MTAVYTYWAYKQNLRQYEGAGIAENVPRAESRNPNQQAVEATGWDGPGWNQRPPVNKACFGYAVFAAHMGYVR